MILHYEYEIYYLQNSNRTGQNEPKQKTFPEYFDDGAHTDTHTHMHFRCIVKVTNQVSIITWSVDDLLIYSMPHTQINSHTSKCGHTHTNQILLFTYLICFGNIINCRWANGHSPSSLGHSLAFFRGFLFIFLIDRILWTTHQRRKNDRHMD